MYTPQNHTFAVCAYGESPYLEECILSLKEQTLSTNILLATSTPNELIQSLCEKYNVPMHVNPGPGGIAGDWNFAVSVCTTPLVTISHQDDLYKPNYAEYMLERVNSSSHPLIYFTNYGELRDGEEVLENRLLKVKRRLLYSLSKPENAGKAWAKRRALELGCAICCPSTTLVLPNLDVPGKQLVSVRVISCTTPVCSCSIAFMKTLRPATLFTTIVVNKKIWRCSRSFGQLLWPSSLTWPIKADKKVTANEDRIKTTIYKHYWHLIASLFLIKR